MENKLTAYLKHIRWLEKQDLRRFHARFKPVGTMCDEPNDDNGDGYGTPRFRGVNVADLRGMRDIYLAADGLSTEKLQIQKEEKWDKIIKSVKKRLARGGGSKGLRALRQILDSGSNRTLSIAQRFSARYGQNAAASISTTCAAASGSSDSTTCPTAKRSIRRSSPTKSSRRQSRNK